MAWYVVTADESVSWDDECKFKYRHRSGNGSPVAQEEFERRRAAGQPAVLWKWEHNESKIMDRCGVTRRVRS